MLEELKEEVLQGNLALPKYGLVTFTWGNVSGIDRKAGLVVIKPSGVEYETMKITDLVVVDLDGNIVEGTLKPSSDTRTHLALYRNFKGIGSIVHTHSSWATTWAQANLDVPALGTTNADTFYGSIPCTRSLTEREINGDYELETGKVIIETFNERGIDPDTVPAVLVSSHGPFVWGQSVSIAVENSVILEEVCKMAYHTLSLVPHIASMNRDLLDKHYLRKHGTNAYYGQKMASMRD